MSKWMMSNSVGKKDGMFTLTVAGFVVTTLMVILSLFDTLALGEFSVKFKDVDSALVLGYLASSLAAYTVRRNKKDTLSTEYEVVEEPVDNQ